MISTPIKPLNKILPNQVRQIQTIFSKQELDREERLQFLTNHFKREIESTKDLTFVEAEELIYFLNTGKKNAANWAFFDKHKFITQRKYLFSLLHQANWVNLETRHVDLERLSNFIKSAKSPVQKPLKQWESEDWSKMIFVFEKIVKGTFNA